MNVAIEIPEDIAKQLSSSWGDMRQRALEAVALEGYRSGAISRSQVGRLLGLNFWETEAFLKEKQAYLPYSESDLARDRAQLDSALGS
jgi:predicted HTH domain antitoxin